MDGIQLRDELTRDRIRLAEEFLDPSRFFSRVTAKGGMLTVVGDARARR